MKAILYQRLASTKGHPVQPEEEDEEAEKELKEKEKKGLIKESAPIFFPPSISEQIIDIPLQEANDLKWIRHVTTRQQLLAGVAEG